MPYRGPVNDRRRRPVRSTQLLEVEPSAAVGSRCGWCRRNVCAPDHVAVLIQDEGTALRSIRLRPQMKAKYDPFNVFRVNQNIVPRAAATSMSSADAFV